MYDRLCTLYKLIVCFSCFTPTPKALTRQGHSPFFVCLFIEEISYQKNANKLDFCLAGHKSYKLLTVAYKLFVPLLHCVAHGTLQSSAAGVVKELVSKAQELKHGKAPDDQPVVTIELDTG